MDATTQAKLLGALNTSIALKGAGVIVVGPASQEVIRLPATGSTAYLVLVPPQSAGLLAHPAQLAVRLKGMGLSHVGNGQAGGSGLTVMAAVANLAEKDKLLNLQKAVQRENLVFSSVSNVLKTRHDTAKNSISNIR